MEPWRRNLVVVFAANSLTSLGMMGFLPSFPSIARSLGVVEEAGVKIWSGALVAGAPLMAAIMGPIWGALGDRYGRKAMVLRAIGAIAFFTAAMSLARTPWQLLGLRLAQGTFSGFVAPALTLVSVGAPPDRQGRVAGSLQSAVFAGAIAGPLLGGLVFDHFGFRVVFRVCSALAVLAFLLVKVFAVEVERGGGTAEPRAIFTPAPMGIGAGAASGFRSVRAGPLRALAEALSDLRGILADPRLRALLIGLFAVRFGASMVDPILQLVVERLKGVPLGYLSTVTGIVFAAHALATFVCLPRWGRWGDRFGHRKALVLAGVAGGLAYLPQGIAATPVLLASLRFLSGGLFAGVLAGAYGLAATTTREERRGGAFGLVLSSLQLAHAIAPLAGGIFAAFLDLRLLFVAAGGAMIGSALLVGRRL